MKQTVVEQLGIAFRQWQKEWDNFDKTGKDKPVSYDKFIKPFLEMEKQQRGYSDEEVIEILKRREEYTSQAPKTDWFSISKWFKQFKKK